MISSMLFVYPKELAGFVADDTFIDQKRKILAHWSETECPEGSVTNCFGVPEAKYKNLVKVGLGTQSTSMILEAIASSIGQTAYQQHMVAVAELAQLAGLQGFTLRVTDIDHPDGYPYVAIGFDSR